MTRIARRDFLEKSLMIGAGAVVSQWPLNLSALSPAKSGKLPLGFQIWTIRDQLIKDFSGTLKKMAHLADWSAVEQKNVAIGKGIVDWKGFFDSAKIGGVKNIFVEMDQETFQDSATYYHSL